MKTIFILCDTLNRRMLSAYGAGEDAAITPNIDRLARQIYQKKDKKDRE